MAAIVGDARVSTTGQDLDTPSLLSSPRPASVPTACSPTNSVWFGQDRSSRPRGMLATPASALGCRGDPHHCRTLRATNYVARLTRRHRYRYPWSSRGGDHGHAGRTRTRTRTRARTPRCTPRIPPGSADAGHQATQAPVASANSSCVASLRPGTSRRACRTALLRPVDAADEQKYTPPTPDAGSTGRAGVDEAISNRQEKPWRNLTNDGGAKADPPSW